MRIALNALYVGSGVAGGRVYRDGLLGGLAAVCGVGPFEFEVFTRRRPDLPPLPGDRFRAIEAPVSQGSTVRRTLGEYGVLPGRVRRGRYAVCHALGSLSPRVRGVPLVLTVHDLIYRDHPESAGRLDWLFRRVTHGRVARSAARVIVDSRYAGEQVVERLGVREDRIRVVLLGGGQGFGPIAYGERVAAVLERYGVQQPYVVAVGRGYPHKNVAGLLRASARLRPRHPDARLVLIGDRFRAGPAVDALIVELGLGDRVVWTGFVGSEDLNALYSGATVFAFPSLAEGFGLPPLEAMACGTPVVASNLTAVPEVVGDAGLLADPRDPEAFAAALDRVLGDETLRAELRARGFKRVWEFTWERFAAETLAVYRELV